MDRPDKPITLVTELLEFDDREFIDAAYRAVLGRTADPDGERYYLGRLRGGLHKLAIVRQMRRSSEGRMCHHGVTGLDAAVRRQYWASRPLIGLLVRAIIGGEGDSPNDRRFRALSNELAQIKRHHDVAQSTEVGRARGSEIAPSLLEPSLLGHAEQSARDLRFQPRFVINATNCYSIHDFMQLHDISFVEAAYRAILHREPDSEGLAYYVRRIREGSSKVRLLSDFTRSQEGASKGTIISGLRTARLMDIALNMPLIGAFMHFLFFSLNIRSHLQELRMLENHIFRIAEESNKINQKQFCRLEAMIRDRP